MNSGHSLQKRRIKSGFGWHFVERPGELLAIPLAIVVKRHVASSGALFRPSIGVVHVTPTFGRRIKRSFRSPNTVQVEKRVDKRHILSDSTIQCASAWHVSCAKRYRSQNRRRCTKSVSNYLSGDIISKYEQSSIFCKKGVNHFGAVYKPVLSSPFDILPLPKKGSKLSPEQLEYRRIRAWELYQENWGQKEIAAALGVTPGAVSQWLKRAKKEGIESLQRHPHQGPQPRLNEQQSQQLTELLTVRPRALGIDGDTWNLDRVTQLIKKEFGIEYDRSHVSRLLRKLDINIRKLVPYRENQSLPMTCDKLREHTNRENQESNLEREAGAD